MEALFRYINATVMGIAALFAPVRPIIICALVFVVIDFVTGVAASRSVARNQGQRWYFESCEAWRTVRKAGFVITAIAMTWLLESCVLDFMQLHLTRLFAGMICGVEMWSFLENASVLSDARLFGWMRRYVHRRINKEIGDEIGEDFE
ncbi:MAG: phage holin family protein [Alistipes sp.]|nr:phage holin family protein [Alistipes sp.]